MAVFPRDQGSSDAGQELLELLQNPYGQQLQQTSIYTALGISVGFTAAIAIAFSFLRPYNQGVYAPKLKHADEQHSPPPIGKAPWSWVTPLWKTSETDLIGHVGMDATIFLRFIRMCRNMFLVMSLLGCCVLIPIHVTMSINQTDNGLEEQRWLARMTPANVWNAGIWGQVVMAWVFNAVIAGFLWHNYRRVFQLRRKYFEGAEYQGSLHARTLMLYDLPRNKCSDEGIASVVDSVVPDSSFARTAIARNVKDIPKLIRQHDGTVRKLEKVLAKYLKNPDQLPPERPTCRPSKKDPSYSTYTPKQKLDAIDYLTERVRALEAEIEEARQSIDKRSSMPYGFASYTDVSEAHNIAYACRKTRPSGATIKLAPRPNDIIWDNVPLNASSRRVKRWINALWVTLLTVVWIGPNAMIAIFLVNLSNLGKVWPGFQRSLEANTGFWGAVQGILSPALLSLFYILLPIIFRRLSIRAGDQTKTGRERHVVGKLYSFFVFNNLIIFTFFSTIWQYIAGYIAKVQDHQDAWALAQNEIPQGLFLALCSISPFWVAWLLQRQLGAAIDLAQLWPLIYGFFMKKLSSPTPRELIELTAPPAFDYASYYNYFLYYATVALFFAGIQPLVLPAAALYFVVDVWLKKYLILYVFITKTESGGVFWKVLFNRFIFAAILSNCVVFLTAWVRGWGTHEQAFAVIPLPVLMILFKIYCMRTFDDRIQFFSTTNVKKHPDAVHKESRLRSERLASKFGHPALYKPLITPMVHQKAQKMLQAVYKGRLSDGRDNADIVSVSGYSDAYALDSMKPGRPGRSANIPGFEFVAESQLDFEHYKNRAEFASEHGGADMYGGALDRPGTPSTVFESEYGSRPGTPNHGRRMFSHGSETDFRPYRTGSPAPFASSGLASPPITIESPLPHSRTPLYAQANDSSTGLVRAAAVESREASIEGTRSNSPMVGAGGYFGLSQEESPRFDYFRGDRGRGRASEAGSGAGFGPWEPGTMGTPGSQRGQ